MDAGADAYLLKPFSPLELLQKIDEFLGETYHGRGKEVGLSSRQSNSVSNLPQLSHSKQW
jgi:DNA-binding response OmpR family regulator